MKNDKMEIKLVFTIILLLSQLPIESNVFSDLNGCINREMNWIGDEIYIILVI